LQGEASGPALLSGESAGIEGSVVALVLCLVVSAFLLAAARRRGNFVGFGGDKRRSVR
jgi:hypothetical protein